jgi:hypothetical protein
MEEYLRRANEALTDFLAVVDAFDRARANLATAGGLPQKTIDKLQEIVQRIREAAGRLRHSLDQIAAETALDVVDLQDRMEGEGASLAAALKALDEMLAKLPAGTPLGGRVLFDLEEQAGRVASAIFPNAIEGIREINRTLWDFRPIWKDYTQVLAEQITGGGRRLTSDQIAKVEEAAGRVDAQIERVNQLLNELVVGGQTTRVQDIIRDARQTLKAAVRDARSRAAEIYKPFHGVLGRAERLAAKIDGQFAKLRVPVFPAADRLDDLKGLVAPDVYAKLTGVERFALLNITARLRSIKVVGGADHLLSARFGIGVFEVFPDRIYFTADASFITAIKALEQARLFEEAPASLHRFKDGSYKQLDGGKGNLQVSYAKGTNENPADEKRVRVDADIDLYRSPIKHLFGEVLVNQLTGSKTDQFKVWDILAAKPVTPIGGFEVVSV